MNTAWFTLRTRRGVPVEVRTYSEPTPTCIRGERTHPIAKYADVSYDVAQRRLIAWWRGRKPWQKRALLNNCLVPGWQPIELRRVVRGRRAR